MVCYGSCCMYCAAPSCCATVQESNELSGFCVLKDSQHLPPPPRHATSEQPKLDFCKHSREFSQVLTSCKVSYSDIHYSVAFCCLSAIIACFRSPVFINEKDYLHANQHFCATIKCHSSLSTQFCEFSHLCGCSPCQAQKIVHQPCFVTCTIANVIKQRIQHLDSLPDTSI